VSIKYLFSLSNGGSYVYCDQRRISSTFSIKEFKLFKQIEKPTQMGVNSNR